MLEGVLILLKIFAMVFALIAGIAVIVIDLAPEKTLEDRRWQLIAALLLILILGVTGGFQFAMFWIAAAAMMVSFYLGYRDAKKAVSTTC
ncbi:MAG: hypothetical protein AAF358_19820 [Pseudomonadota bacterium]